MKCVKCSRRVRAGLPRCPGCGAVFTEADIRRKRCTECGKNAEQDRIFCPDCGHLLEKVLLQGQELVRLRSASMYTGERAIGIPQATGDLIVRDDRVEFIPVEGTGMGRMLGALGRMMTEAPEHRETETFWLEEIRAVEAGRAAGLVPSLTLRLTDGRIFSFSAMSNAGGVNAAAAMIDTYRSYT